MWRLFVLCLCSTFLLACHNDSGSNAGSGTPDMFEGLAASQDRPPTIPAMREWYPRSGRLVFPDQGEITYDSNGLADTTTLLAAELTGLTGGSYTASGQGSGIVHLTLNSDGVPGHEEGHLVNIDNTVEIRGNSVAGVFYGTRSLLQLLTQDNNLPTGIVRDWPRYPERGLMVDIGRMYFTVKWLENHIRDLAWLKLNYLHLHLADNEGWRVESERYPQIVSDPHLSKQELAALIELARLHQITVVPEIDMPGHMTAALAPFPEFHLTNALGQAEEDKLDVANDAARAYAHDLIDEYMPLFPGPYWHMGADEYLGIVSTEASYELYPQLQEYARAKHGEQANHKDAVIDFINETNALVRSHGKTMRVWHDGLGGGAVLQGDNNMIVEVWNDFAGLQPLELLQRGHLIFNAGWYPTYYTQSVFGLVRPQVDSAYETWQVHQFYGPFALNDTLSFPPTEIDPDDPRNLGSKIHVWSDVPQLENEDEVAAGIFPRLRMLAQKTWESELLVESYAEFEPIMGAIGHAPGYQP